MCGGHCGYVGVWGAMRLCKCGGMRLCKCVGVNEAM